VLFIGASGCGKSSLALQLLGLGADLIADDQVVLVRKPSGIWASKPQSLPSKIEARGVGLIAVPLAPPAKIMLIVDLDETEEKRFPEARQSTFFGENITVWRKSNAHHFPAAIFVYLNNIKHQASLESFHDNDA
jgi:HPr kinase/phosphorylase